MNTKLQLLVRRAKLKFARVLFLKSFYRTTVIEYVDDKFHTIMDPEGKFLEANKDIPRWIIDSSMLIDRDSKIKMVGAPWLNEEMA